MIAAFAIVATYPLPHVPGGWCRSGFTPHHYAVQTVTRIAMYVDLGAAAAVVVAAGAATGRVGRGLLVAALTAVPVGAFLVVTAATYIGRINCAFYG